MAPSPCVLIVDDQTAVREELAYALEFDGFRTAQAGDGPGCLDAVAAGGIDAVLLDVKLPGIDGLQVLEELRRRPEGADLPVVVISGHGDIETAVQAVKTGAYDYLAKPFDPDRVVLSVRNALRMRSLQAENTALRQELTRGWEILGSSAAVEEMRRLIAKVAPTQAQVLITGENGTGKELVARQVHGQSPRGRSGPFVAVNCAAIPHDLIESELFGHEKGAFTGAHRARAGHFEAAHGGTLLLDEVGELALDAQAKLLRALNDRVVTRVGGREPIRVDVRVLAATNQELEAMVADKTFREDLYYRLHVVRIAVPALRERVDDIEELAVHFLAAACRTNGLPKRKLDARALKLLREHPWPGNVRELKNLMEAAAILAEDATITGEEIGELLITRGGQLAGVPAGDWFGIPGLEEFRAATEREFIRRKLAENGGNVKRTAERIGIQRSNLYKKLERYGLK